MSAQPLSQVYPSIVAPIANDERVTAMLEDVVNGRGKEGQAQSLAADLSPRFGACATGKEMARWCAASAVYNAAIGDEFAALLDSIDALCWSGSADGFDAAMAMLETQTRHGDTMHSGVMPHG